jgi:hypothetical protein
MASNKATAAAQEGRARPRAHERPRARARIPASPDAGAGSTSAVWPLSPAPRPTGRASERPRSSAPSRTPPAGCCCRRSWSWSLVLECTSAPAPAALWECPPSSDGDPVTGGAPASCRLLPTSARSSVSVVACKGQHISFLRAPPCWGVQFWQAPIDHAITVGPFCIRSRRRVSLWSPVGRKSEVLCSGVSTSAWAH